MIIIMIIKISSLSLLPRLLDASAPHGTFPRGLCGGLLQLLLLFSLLGCEGLKFKIVRDDIDK